MSKATIAPVRICVLTVACTDWQGNPTRSNSMSRLYSVTTQWEARDPGTGALCGEFLPAASLCKNLPWVSTKAAVKWLLYISSDSAAAKDTWTPVFLVRDGGLAERMAKELSSMCYRFTGPPYASAEKMRNFHLADALAKGELRLFDVNATRPERE